LYNHRYFSNDCTIIVQPSYNHRTSIVIFRAHYDCSCNACTTIVQPLYNHRYFSNDCTIIVQSSYNHRTSIVISAMIIYPPKVPSLRYAKRFFGGPRFRFVTPPAGTPRHQANTPAGPADARAPPSRRHLSTSPGFRGD
jgi:hypothetical protein